MVSTSAGMDYRLWRLGRAMAWSLYSVFCRSPKSEATMLFSYATGVSSGRIAKKGIGDDEDEDEKRDPCGYCG